MTGDAVGQKASQTLQNIVAADCVLNKVRVLRPLVGMNKQKIETVCEEDWNLRDFDSPRGR